MSKNAVVSRSSWRTVKRVLFYLFIFQFVYILALRWINPPITITQLSNWVNGNGMRRDYV
ncbi:MAG: monofunctional biosynthetic peptidoglycan transglycosylase, partial [Bacteroidota bacterium]